MIRRPSPGPFVSFVAILLSAAAAEAGPPGVGDTAPDFTLKAPGGESVRLATLREKGPVALVVLRGWPGYQCLICTPQVGELLGKSKEIAASEASVTTSPRRIQLIPSGEISVASLRSGCLPSTCTKTTASLAQPAS